MLEFHRISFSCSSSSDSVMMTRLSAYRFSQGHPTQNSWKRASRTMMNSRGLRQEPWWTPTFALNSSLRLQPKRTLLLVFFCMLCMRCTSQSSMLSMQRAHQITLLGTRSSAFSRSTKAMYSVLLMTWNFPCTVNSRYLAPVGSQNSRARVKWFSQNRDFQDQSPTLWRLHLLNANSMLSDNGCTYISRISADVDIAPATNHNKPYYILIITHQKLSNYTLHKAAYNGICAETSQTTMRVDRKRK